MLTAEHLKFAVGQTFSYEGQTRTVTATVTNGVNDFAILFFTPSATNTALINIETNDIASDVVLQGRGRERGQEVVRAGGQTNGWEWGSRLYIRRWGVNKYFGETADGVCALAAFDNTGDPDECMLSPGDSGGPGFIRTGSGWKVATVNMAVYPSRFTVSTNPVSYFDASLYDCAGLFYDDEGGSWVYVPEEESPSPCLLINTRTSKSVAWITNTVPGITFPADVGVAWRCATNRPAAGCASTGLWFEVVATNAGPFVARNVAIDVSWAVGVRPAEHASSLGTFETNRWWLPALNDGGAATLRVDAVVWRAAAGWGTNTASVTASDKPDPAVSNNAAACEIYLPATATRFMIE